MNENKKHHTTSMLAYKMRHRGVFGSAKKLSKVESFDDFMNKVAFWFLNDQGFQETVEAAGIDFRFVPDGSIGVEVVQEYLDQIKIYKDHSVVYKNLIDKIKLVDDAVLDLDIDNDYEDLASRYGALLSEKNYAELGKMLIEYPKNGKEILELFDFDAHVYASGGIMKDVLIKENIKYAQKLRENSEKIYLKDFPKLSHMIGGFNPGRFTIMTGKTGFGKSNLGLNLALSAQKTMGVSYINMEMSYEDMFKRLGVIMMNCGYEDFANKDFYKVSDVDQAIRRNVSDSFFMTDGKTLTVDQAIGATKTKGRKMSKKPGLMIVDYDQRLGRSDSEDSDSEWRYILKDAVKLEDFAKSENIHVILMCQLNAQGYIAASKRMLNIAHTWLDFYKDELHGPVIHAKKNRHGATDIATLVRYDSANIKELSLVRVEG